MAEDHELSSVQKLKDHATFPLWELEVETLFESKNLLGIVDGTEKLSDSANDKEKKDWKTRDAKARGYILRTIDPVIKIHVLTKKTSKDMYDALKKVYKRDTAQTKQQLMTEFLNYKWDKNISLLQNVSVIRNMAFRLVTAEEKISDDMVMTKILLSLPDQYKHFPTAWNCMTEKEKSIDNLQSKLAMEEERLKKKEPAVAFNAESKIDKTNKNPDFKKYKNKQQHQRHCRICKRKSHTEENCWGKKYELRNDYPVCQKCKRTNHPEEFCKQRNETERRKQGDSSEKTKDSCLNEKVCFHVEKNKYPKAKFCVDSGSTSHMTKDENLLTETWETEPVTIRLAKKDNNMISNVEGNIETNDIIFKNVTYVPDLTRNLLSVSAITEFDNKVLFTKDKVEIINKNSEVILKGKKMKVVCM